MPGILAGTALATLPPSVPASKLLRLERAGLQSGPNSYRQHFFPETASLLILISVCQTNLSDTQASVWTYRRLCLFGRSATLGRMSLNQDRSRLPVAKVSRRTTAISEQILRRNCDGGRGSWGAELLFRLLELRV